MNGDIKGETGIDQKMQPEISRKVDILREIFETFNLSFNLSSNNHNQYERGHIKRNRK